MTAETKARKRELRAELIAARARLHPAERAEASRRVAERLDGLEPFAAAATVALYAPLGTEVDVLEVARRAAAAGKRLLFPRSLVAERRLVFCACRPGELVRGPLGAGEPPAGAPEVALDSVDCFLVPGVAFSEDGQRLGRGGGYYDATLRLAPRAARVGVAFDLQVVPSLPAEPHDAPLDAVVTEARVLRFARGGAAHPPPSTARPAP